MKKSLQISCLLMVVCLAGCHFLKFQSSEEKKLADMKEITQVIDSCIGWAKNKNLNKFYSCIVNDNSYLSVRPEGGIIRGAQSLKKSESFWMSPDFQYIKHEIKDLNISISQCGTVAWFYCMLDDRNTWKGQPANWLNTRWTGVLENSNGKWRIVQQHFSWAGE